MLFAAWLILVLTALVIGSVGPTLLVSDCSGGAAL